MSAAGFDVDAAVFAGMVSRINPLIGATKRETMDAVALVLQRLAFMKDADNGAFDYGAEERTAESHVLRTLAAALTYDPVRAIDALDNVVKVQP